MNTFTILPTRPRLAAMGMAAMMTLGVLAGIGTLAETQAADPAAAMATTPEAAPVVQQVQVTGQRAPRS